MDEQKKWSRLERMSLTCAVISDPAGGGTVAADQRDRRTVACVPTMDRSSGSFRIFVGLFPFESTAPSS